MKKNEQAYQQIKEMIMSNELKGDQLVSENELSEMLGMSRTPVREAIYILSNEGFVNIYRGVGIQICRTTIQEVRELYPIRCFLECYALRCSLKHIPRMAYEDLIDRWKKYLQNYDSMGETQARRQLFELDAATHSFFIEYAGNETLKQMIDLLKGKIFRFQMMSFSHYAGWRQTANTHIQILEAMENGDIETACQLMTAHLERPWQTAETGEGSLL